jgi:2-polyprenyl-3-methyl-5-hydroxy-6-metoxy-1,4-benzoquinol methylase
MSDVVRSNAMMGGRRAALREVEASIVGLAGEVTLLDVGTGLGDIPAGASVMASRHGLVLRTIGLDGAESLVRRSIEREQLVDGVCGDAMALPFRARSVDIVLCSQVLHHFEEPNALRLITELDRVARHRVIVSDLRRSWLAAAGFWLASVPLRFDPITRHDGVLSVLRGFTTTELRGLVEQGTGADPCVRRWSGYRITASWTPRSGTVAA